MAHRLVVLEWLYKADQDFGFAEKSLEKGNLPYFDQIGFFLHQAIIRGKLEIEGEVTKRDLERENEIVDEILKDSKE